MDKRAPRQTIGVCATKKRNDAVETLKIVGGRAKLVQTVPCGKFRFKNAAASDKNAGGKR